MMTSSFTFKFVISIFFCILLILCALNPTVASTNTYSEHFDNLDPNGNPIGWHEVLNPEFWKVVNGRYTVELYHSDPQTISYFDTPSDFIVDSVEVKVTGESGPDRFVMFRFDSTDTTVPGGYILKWYEKPFESKIEMWGVNKEFCTHKNEYFFPTLGDTYTVKISSQENNINVFFNEILKLECYINNIIETGKVGFYLHSSGMTDPNNNYNWFVNRVSYDDLIIKGHYPSNLFNLPFNYTVRTNPTQPQFRNTFWNRMTASFDHNKLGNQFVPFTTSLYNKKDCLKNAIGIKCYDAHNGTDFAPHERGANDEVYPTSDGIIVYTSEKGKNGKCVPDKSGYGCVIIMYHPDLDVYTLYAHLSEINKTVSDSIIEYTDPIGKMGNTGCGPKCGVHIHLGVLKDKTPSETKKPVGVSDWESLLYQSEPMVEVDSETNPKHYCSYVLPNGNILSFQDPSGWSDNSKQDPWALSKNLGSCGTVSPYLWMHEIGTSANIQQLWYSESLN